MGLVGFNWIFIKGNNNSASKDMIVTGSRLKENISLEDGILIGLFY